MSFKINFTNDQKVAIDGIISFIAAPFNPSKFMIGLNGAGGTGKTFITKHIIQNCKYSSSVIKCTSPTHKACRVFSQAIGGKEVDTIQSTFGMRMDVNIEEFDPSNPKFAMKGRIKLDGIRLLIIDESSMLNGALVNAIRKKCLENEVKILFIGDSSQLAPVNEKESTAFKLCSELYTLKQVVRQEEDNPIKELLNILRDDIRNKTVNFLKYIQQNANFANINDEGKGFVVCTPAEFVENIDRCFSNEEYTKNINLYRIICYTNMKVTSWNNYVRNNIIKNADKSVLTRNDLIMSYNTIVDEFLSPIIYNSEEYIINDIVDFVDDKYNFKGYLVKFQSINGGSITKPLFILDHKDKGTILQYCKIVSNLISDAKSANAIARKKKWGEYYDFCRKYLILTNVVKDDKILFKRDLDYGFAITSHKSQGSTYENVFVDLNDIMIDKNGRFYTDLDDMLRRIYVAFSRASKQLIICYGR